MKYADTDFFLALMKKDDWLQEKATQIKEENEGKITTSIVTILECLIIGKKYGLDPETIVGSIFSMAKVTGITPSQAMKIAHNIKHENINVFDSFHAELARDKPIISSDQDYKELGLERIKLEEE